MRETWHAGIEWDADKPSEIDPFCGGSDIWYPADGTYTIDYEVQTKFASLPPSMGKRRPSIHMPRWACRLVLDVTDVRVERVQGITQSDILCEGVLTKWGVGMDSRFPELWTGLSVDGNQYTSPFRAFAAMWNSCTKSPYKWSDNPWVWVPTFTPETSR